MEYFCLKLPLCSLGKQKYEYKSIRYLLLKHYTVFLVGFKFVKQNPNFLQFIVDHGVRPGVWFMLCAIWSLQLWC